MDLKKKEQKIIELLETGPKAYTEIKILSNGLLDNDSTLSRYLTNLKNYGLIEKNEFNDPDSKYRNKYYLTEKYYKIKEEKQSKSQFSKIISSRLYWQATHNRLLDYLEIKYPILLQKSSIFNINEIISDMFSYLVHFDIIKNQLPKNYEYYFDLMLYLIINHPDQKYNEIKEKLDLEYSQFSDQIDLFTKNKKLEEFSFKEPNTFHKTKFFLISDDPILYQIKQQIETSFSKFLLCWQFPYVKLEDYFDFILQFSYYIYNDLKTKYNEHENYEKLIHLNNSKLLFIIYARQYILEQLTRIETQADIEIPLELLTIEQKNNYRAELITSSQIFTSNDRKSLEQYFSFSVENVKQISYYIKEILKKIDKLINNPKNAEKIVYLKSHLLFLIRLFHHYNKNLFNKTKRELSKNYNVISLKYSELSKDIYESIIKLSIGLKKESDYNNRYFTTSNFLERVDHLLNQLNKGKHDKNRIKNEIHEIFNITSQSLSEKSMYPFFQKKCEIFLRGFKIFSESEIINTLNSLMERYPVNLDIGKLAFWFLTYTNKIDEFEKIIQPNNWKIYDKIYLLTEFVQKCPIEINIEGFLDLGFDLLQNNFDIFKENERKALIKLLKILALFYERKNELENAFLFYYLATELEQIALNPSNRNVIYQIFPLIQKESEILKNPAYFNLIKISKKYNEDLNFVKEKITPLINIFFKYLFNINIEEEIENLNKSISFLINALEYLFSFFKFDKSFKNLEYSKKSEIQVQKIIESDIFTAEERGILLKAKKNIEKFVEINPVSFLRATSVNIHFLLNPINNIEELLNMDENYRRNSSQPNVNYNIFARTNLYSQNNFFIPIIQFNQNLNVNYANISNYAQNPLYGINKKIIRDFVLIKYHFRIPLEEKDYPFALAFSKIYKVPDSKTLDFWDRLIQQLKSDPLQLMELLDIFIYHSRNFNDFEKLEKISFIILDYYGIEWAIRYIDTFIEYFKWYNERLENPQSKWYPYTLEIIDLNLYFSFYIDLIKTNLYWEYRDRNSAQNFLNRAYQSLETLKNRGVKLIGNFPLFEKKLIELYKKLNQ